MTRTISNETTKHIGEKIRIEGWVHNFRKLGKIAFLVLRDRGGLIQTVVEDQNTIEKLSEVQVGSIVKVEGTVKETDSQKLGVEIVEPEIEIFNAVTEPMPLDITKDDIHADLDTILDNRPIALRHIKQKAIFKVQAEIVRAYREFLISEGFTEFFGPNVIGASSEGGAELFTVNYFDTTAMLSQSAQLYKQMMVAVHERVFALMKCYRAEKSNTRRHLTEATQFEFEMGFINDFSDVMDMLEKTLKHIVKTVAERCKDEIELLGTKLPLAPEDISFPRVKFRDALEIYFKRTGIDERNENDLSPAAEKELCLYAREEFGTDFIFITNFLRSKTAFYAKPSDEDPTVTNYFDLLCREVEIVSGGQRINDHDELVESLKLKGLNPDNFRDYLSIFKYGMPKHGGFGMGMERLTMMMLNLENIREATLFPSDPRRIAANRIKRDIVTGGKNVVAKIQEILKSRGKEFTFEEHEAVTTSEEAAKVRGTKIEEGAKAIVLRKKKGEENIMVVLPANRKINLKSVEEKIGEKVEFEKPEVILNKYGIEVGGVPPFGHLLGMRVLFDNDILNREAVNFNCGERTASIMMKSKDLADVVECELGEWSI